MTDRSGDKEKILEIVDQGKDFLHAGFLYLVIKGLKPVTEIHSLCLNDGNLVKEKSGYVGLYIHEAPREESMSLYVAKNPDLLAEAVEIGELLKKSGHSKMPELDRRLGEYMGYPPSAIHAYIFDELLSEEEEREMCRQLNFNNLVPFPFRLSRNHYREELSFIQSWYGPILRDIPEIFDRKFSPHDALVVKDVLEKFLRLSFTS